MDTVASITVIAMHQLTPGLGRMPPPCRPRRAMAIFWKYAHRARAAIIEGGKGWCQLIRIIGNCTVVMHHGYMGVMSYSGKKQSWSLLFNHAQSGISSCMCSAGSCVMVGLAITEYFTSVASLIYESLSLASGCRKSCIKQISGPEKQQCILPLHTEMATCTSGHALRFLLRDGNFLSRGYWSLALSDLEGSSCWYRNQKHKKATSNFVLASQL